MVQDTVGGALPRPRPLAGVAGCPSLDIANKNAPERERAFSDPVR